MVQSLNQFAQAPSLGDIDLGGENNIIAAVLASGSADVAPGQAVKIVDNASGVPTVEPLAADTDQTYGFVARNNKDAVRSAGEPLELAQQLTVIWLEAGAAIARGAEVEYDVSADEVITAAGTNPAVGRALDKAAAAGDLIRVQVYSPRNG